MANQEPHNEAPTEREALELQKVRLEIDRLNHPI